MYATRSRAKIPAIFYFYVVAVLAMTALAVSRVNGAAGLSATHHSASLISDQRRRS